ncbi:MULTISPECIES: hypothetical protein [Gammaproteobacteria]|uniref:hypothetical protein n=1 Tax=Acinetobacter sp. HRXRD-152 TaxID=3404808 RepID=UPI003BB77C29
MIETIKHKVEDYFTEGFGISSPDPLSISVSDGKFVKKMRVNEDHVWSEQDHLGFTLELESDDLFEVVYNFYLLEQPNSEGQTIVVDRVEMAKGVIPFYDGDDVIQHCLISITLPALCEEISDASGRINYVELMNSANQDQ